LRWRGRSRGARYCPGSSPYATPTERHGNSLSSLTKTLTIGGANSTSARIEGLTRGTWYFAVVAYTTSGVESALSAAAAKSIY
jgi:hypothetical protein